MSEIYNNKNGRQKVEALSGEEHLIRNEVLLGRAADRLMNYLNGHLIDYQKVRRGMDHGFYDVRVLRKHLRVIFWSIQVCMNDDCTRKVEG